MEWDFDARVCGNCKWWALSPYGKIQWEHGRWNRPSGAGGYNTDGSVSGCQRRSPVGVKSTSDVIKQAVWPETQRHDSCGEFEVRPGERALNEFTKIDPDTGETTETILQDWRGNEISRRGPTPSKEGD